MNFIHYLDLLGVFRWENVACESVILKSSSDDIDFTYLYLKVFDNEGDTYKRLSSVAENAKLCNCFSKADIWGAENTYNHNQKPIKFYMECGIVADNYQKELFDLYINNDYYTLFERAKSVPDEREKAYWLYCENLYCKLSEEEQTKKIVAMFEKISNQVHTGNSSIFWSIVDKTNWLLLL
ncbi:MAG: hypothetical protein LBE79_13080, partial [Tannerella sp.]|nr:hypothetical protein [Tannerella sp.]